MSQNESDAVSLKAATDSMMRYYCNFHDILQFCGRVKSFLIAHDDTRAIKQNPLSREYFEKHSNGSGAIIVQRDDTLYSIDVDFDVDGISVGLTVIKDNQLQGCITLPHIQTEGQLEDLIKALRG